MTDHTHSPLLGVGVTDTPAGRRAVDWAADRAQHTRQEIQLITVVGGAIGVIGEGEILARALTDAERHLDEEAERLRARGVKVSTRVMRGRPVEQLVAASASLALLVLGSDHTPGSDRARGPHGSRIAAGAASPVIVVPDVGVSPRSGVVVGVDGSPSSEAAVAFAAAEADRLREPLTLLSTWLPLPLPLGMDTYPAEYLANMQSLTEETLAIASAGLSSSYPDLALHRLVSEADPATALTDASASARLTVVGTHGRGPLIRFLLGSTSQRVLAHPTAVTAVVR